MAAWVLIKNDQQAEGLKVLRAMLVEKSYATLKILNVVDWIGAAAAPLLPVIDSLKLNKYEARVQETLREKFSADVR